MWWSKKVDMPKGPSIRYADLAILVQVNDGNHVKLYGTRYEISTNGVLHVFSNERAVASFANWMWIKGVFTEIAAPTTEAAK